jgi:sulfur carrier protein
LTSENPDCDNQFFRAKSKVSFSRDPPLRESEAACEDQQMQVVINGENRNFEAPLTLAGLVQVLGMKTGRVAVELNREIVPRDQWDRTQLADGDRLEIVHFVGGG